PGYLPFASLRHLYGLDRGGLITDGVFRFSRNPQYTGIGLALTGAALAARSGLALAVAGAYWAGIRAWLVVEEAHLEEAFGARYTRYREHVARFLGRPPGSSGFGC
ncbi:MAG TPA: methyltransferase, partial [Solirubrobacteraceae bacterium]|nr:methyltransferase [Solirubrobacteraceae bacterium]